MAFKPRRADGGGKPAPRRENRDGSGSGDRDFRPSPSQDGSFARPQRRDEQPRRNEGGDYRDRSEDRSRSPRKTDGARNFDRDRSYRPRTGEGGTNFDRPKLTSSDRRGAKPRTDEPDWGRA